MIVFPNSTFLYSAICFNVCLCECVCEVVGRVCGVLVVGRVSRVLVMGCGMFRGGGPVGYCF